MSTPYIDMSDRNFEESILSDIWKTVKGGCPSKLEAVLFKYSEESKSFDLAIGEWHMLGVVTADFSWCICSHKIQDKYFIKNTINGNILRIGSECIHKFLSDDIKEEARDLRTQLKYQQKGNSSHRMCSSCKRHSIPIDEESWKTICRTCFKKGVREVESLALVEGRICIICNRPTIPLDEPEWKTKCRSCYKTVSTEEEFSSQGKGFSSTRKDFSRQGKEFSTVKKKDFLEESSTTKEIAQSLAKQKGLSQPSKGTFAKKEFTAPKVKPVSSEGCRKCSLCGEFNISQDEPTWKVKCLTCYLKSK
jgi:hypothetical protein